MDILHKHLIRVSQKKKPQPVAIRKIDR